MATLFRIPHQSTSGGGTTYDVEYGTGFGSTYQMVPDTDYLGSENGTNRWNFTHFGDGSGWNSRNFMRYTRWSTVEGSPECGFGFDPPTVISPETWGGLGNGPFYLRFRMRTNSYMGAGGHNGGMKWFIWGGPGLINGTQRMILFIRNGSDGGGTNAGHTTIDPTAGVSGSSAPALAPNGQWNHIQISWKHGVAADNPYMRVFVNNNNESAPDSEHTAFTDIGGDWEKPESWGGCNWGNIVTDNSVSDTDAEFDFMDVELGTTFDSAWFPDGVTVSATTDALILTEYPAAIIGSTTIQTVTDALILTEQTATVALNVNISAGTDVLVLTENAADIAIVGVVEVLATTQTLVLAEYQADVNLIADETTTAVPGDASYMRPRKKRKHRDREEEIRQERIRLGILPPDPVIVEVAPKAPEPQKPEPLSEVDAEIAALMAVALQSDDIAREIAELMKVVETKKIKRNRTISLLLLAA